MPYKLRSDHPGCAGVAVVSSDTGQVIKCHPDRGKALAHLRALYANVADAAAIPAGYVPGGPRPVVIEHHPGCPPSHPHGITDGPGGHLLACHATPAEARAIAEKLDLSEPSGDGGTAAARGGFDPLKHPRVEHGHGGGEFTHAPGSGAPRPAGHQPKAPAQPELIGYTLWSSGEGSAPPVTPEQAQAAGRVWYNTNATSTNSWLRTGEYEGKPPPAQFQSDVRTLTSLINASKPFTRPALMWRATHLGDRLFGPPGTAAGKTFTDKGLVSLSASEETVHSYGDTLIRVHVPPGARAMHADPAMWTAAGNADRPIGTVQEFTLPPDSRWQITADQPYHSMFGGNRVLDVTLLPPATPARPAPRAAAPRPASGPLPGGADRFAWRPGDVEFGTAAARGNFRPDLHPRLPGGKHGGGEFTHSPGGGGTTGHLHDGIADPPPSAALTFNGRFTLRDLPPGDKFLAKVNAKLTQPLIGTGPNKGKVRRPAVPPYRESVARTSAALLALIEQQGTLEQGRNWYPDEHAMNHRRALAYHVPIQTAIGVEAATCPRVQWIINQRVTNELLDEVPKTGRTAEQIKVAHHFGGGVMASFRDEGVNIILGADLDKELGGTKRRNFYNNIMWPGQTDSVTVDTWMLQTLKPLGLSDDQAMALGQQAMAGLADGIGKVIVADALRDASDRLRAQGTDITPDGVQAAAWIAIQKQLGLSDPSAHENPRDVGYMHAAAAADPDDEGAVLDNDQWDAELLIQYLTWLSEHVPGGRDLGSPGSARPQGGLAADNPAAWKLALADPRFGRLGMTTAQARQAARGPDTQAAAKLPAGPYTAQENHPACPAGTPHGTVHSATGEVIRCHRTPAAAQDLALTLNFPDATPATPGATMVTSAAKGQFRNDLHPRRPDGKFAPKGQGGPARPRTPGQVPRQPATAPARRMGETRPVPPPGPGSPGASPPAADPSLATADLSKLIREQVTAAAAQLTADQHEQLREVQAQLERSQAQLAELHKQESESEEAAKEKRKTVRKLIHHVVALFTVAALTFIGVKTGSLENPMFAGLAATGPLFIQEGLDALKRV